MQCTHVQSQLDNYIDAELTIEEQSQLATHLQACTSCRNEYEQRQALLQQLRSMPVPPMRSEFVAHVSASLNGRHKSHRRGFVTGFGSAIAASLAIWFVVSTLLLQPKQEIGLVAVHLVPNEIHKVNLVFKSPTALADATMSIELPANVVLSGYPGKRILTWTTALQQGNNRMQLPLILLNQQPARVITRISRDGSDKIFYLELNAANTPTAQLQTSTQIIT